MCGPEGALKSDTCNSRYAYVGEIPFARVPSSIFYPFHIFDIRYANNSADASGRGRVPDSLHNRKNHYASPADWLTHFRRGGAHKGYAAREMGLWVSAGSFQGVMANEWIRLAVFHGFTTADSDLMASMQLSRDAPRKLPRHF